MTKQAFDINTLRVASPCSVSWDAMRGDARARHCESCRLNVYNIAALTEKEAEELIRDREGRLCIRLYKRADGTVLTKDCPVGLRAYRKRVARLAGAALTAVLGLFSVSYGQKDDKKAVDASKLKMTRTADRENVLRGMIVDPNGAVVPGAEIRLYKDKIAVAKIQSDENGEYSFPALPAGVYFLEAVFPGFETYRVKNIRIADNKRLGLNIELSVDSESVMVGVFLDEGLIDPGSSSLKTTITRQMIDRMP